MSEDELVERMKEEDFLMRVENGDEPTPEEIHDLREAARDISRRNRIVMGEHSALADYAETGVLRSDEEVSREDYLHELDVAREATDNLDALALIEALRSYMHGHAKDHKGSQPF